MKDNSLSDSPGLFSKLKLKLETESVRCLG